MVYPTLIAAVSDASQPRDRARVVGVYRFWRDFGFVVGALDRAASAPTPPRRRPAIAVVAALTAASGLVRRRDSTACAATRPRLDDPIANS